MSAKCSNKITIGYSKITYAARMRSKKSDVVLVNIMLPYLYLAEGLHEVSKVCGPLRVSLGFIGLEGANITHIQKNDLVLKVICSKKLIPISQVVSLGAIPNYWTKNNLPEGDIDESHFQMMMESGSMTGLLPKLVRGRELEREGSGLRWRFNRETLKTW